MEKSKYNISIISFFDILGFRNIVDGTNDPDEVLRILETLKYQTIPSPEESALILEQKVSNFSDTVVRTTNIVSEINREYQLGILYNEFLDLIYIQYSLINDRDVFIRGSVTIDEIYQDSSYVFGSGLNRAYDLEKEVAIYPRIIIDHRVFSILEGTELLKASYRDLSTEKNYIKNIVRESDDGVWFLDYLKAMNSGVAKFFMSTTDSKRIQLTQFDYGKFLRHHKQLVIKKSKEFEDLNHIAVKYSWLARYHNDVIESISDKEFESIGISQNELHITKDEVKTIYEF